MHGRWDFIEATTGPIMLHTAVAAYRAAGGSGLTVLDPGVIYPIDWRNTVGGPRDGAGDEHSVCNPAHPRRVQRKLVCACRLACFFVCNSQVHRSPGMRRFDAAACKLRFPDAYALTYWTHTWG